MKRIFLLSLMAFALAACTTTTGAQRYSGTLDWSFETSAFRTDDGQGPWWLSAEDGKWRDVVAPLQSTGSPYGHLHLVVEGELSAPGQYGHLGAYARTLRVTRVIETRLISASSPPSGS
ncbi:MAG: hypothetical protein ABUL73_00005 [Alphaproteobacteria bacterium]